jgi:alanyl-tRNA synthetase
LGLEGSSIPGETVFKLYDTFGFPADLTADVAREQGLTIDQASFETAMDEQRQRARSASQFGGGNQIRFDGLDRTPFVGYQNLAYEAAVAGILRDETPVERLEQGEDGMLLLDQTPFYAESGGQTGDHGSIVFEQGVFEVSDTQYIANKVIAHIGIVTSGTVAVDQPVTAKVESKRRFLNANNHSATHLLHAALKSVLGNHVEQKGSLVEPRRLRFDFSHFEPVNKDQLLQIEKLVNREIRANHDVVVDVMDLKEAKSTGAEALFGEKYDEQVRVVRMGEFSFELCGGTHVERTGDIGILKIVAESGIAAGIRRIEAYTGNAAEEYINEQLAALGELSSRLKISPTKLGDRISALLEQQKKQERQIQSLQTRLATGGATDYTSREINGVKVAAIRQDDADARAMRMTIDQWRSKHQSGIVLVAGSNNGKVTIIAGVSKDLQDMAPAGDLIREIAPLVDGKGGGKPDLAQGGGSNVAGIEEAMEATYRWVESSLG